MPLSVAAAVGPLTQDETSMAPVAKDPRVEQLAEWLASDKCGIDKADASRQP